MLLIPGLKQEAVLVLLKENSFRGARVAQLVKHPILGFSSGPRIEPPHWALCSAHV